MAVIKLNKNNFEETVKAAPLALIDFYADWCGPCRMVSPIIDQIAEEEPELVVGKVNVDEEPELAEEFGVTSIPMIAVLKNGKVANTIVGARPKAAIMELLK